MPYRRDRRIGDRTIAASLAAAVLLNAPLIDLVDRDPPAFWFGMPAVFVYVFAVWLLLIIVLVVAVRRPDSRRNQG